MRHDILALRWRPIRFSDVVGQKHVTAILKAMVRAGDVPPSLIFGGSRGTGKTSCARIFAAALNCAEGNGDSCGECASCVAVQNTNSMSVLEIDAASNGGVDQVRSIRDLCQYAHGGQWRVVLLDEAHSMSDAAFNALLKILEEPPGNTVFILLTTEVDKIMETVRSRSMLFDFRRISPSVLTEHLAKIAEAEGIPYTEGLLDLIAGRCGGGMRDAVMLLDQIRRAGIENEDQYGELFGFADISEELFLAAATGDIAKGCELIEDQYRRTGDAGSITNDLTRLIRDLLIIKSGGKGTESRTQLAGTVDANVLTRVIGLLWDLKSRLRGFDHDQRMALEMAFVLISEALQPKAQVKQLKKPIKVVEEEKRLLDISEVRNLLAS